jgi:hypothetical protein
VSLTCQEEQDSHKVQQPAHHHGRMTFVVFLTTVNDIIHICHDIPNKKAEKCQNLLMPIRGTT